MKNSFKDLENKNVVITGGLGFLGKQFLKSFVDNKSNVIILDIKSKNKIPKEFININNVSYYKCNISKEKELIKLSKIINRKFKNIDVLINGASNDYVPKNKLKNNFSLETFNTSDWDKDIQVGLKGVFLSTKIFGSLMKKNPKGGSIINISSDLGIISPDQRIYKKLNFFKPISYSAIKHGIIGLTKYTATYWAKYKIRCNAIAPGGMYNNQNKNFLKEVKKLIPMNRLGKLDEYNSIVLFLASEGSSYITGSTVVIDGGRTIW